VGYGSKGFRSGVITNEEWVKIDMVRGLGGLAKR